LTIAVGFTIVASVTKILMSQDQLIKLKSTKSGYTYYTRKNKKLVTRKIELKKYDPTVRKHVIFKEAKK
jgi:large subunit ribosomal protein L33